MMIPTHLMIEQLEAAKMPLPKGISNEQKKLSHCTVSCVTVEGTEGIEAIGKPAGRYVTVETEKTYELGEPAFEQIAGELSSELRRMLKGRKRVLIIGIGNPAITPDSLGKKAVDRIMVTRPLDRLPEGYSIVSALASPVFGASGLETFELVKGVVSEVKPEQVILIDALATASLSRLCKTVQLADVGLSPGAGVGNKRPELNQETLGVPVISVGMPTVVDCRALLSHVLGDDWESYADALHPFEESLIALPRQMELATDMGARIIAFALNKALHGNLSTEEILRYLY